MVDFAPARAPLRVLTAVMRKLLHGIVVMFRHDEDYHGEKQVRRVKERGISAPLAERKSLAKGERIFDSVSANPARHLAV
jgi:hypothetical protein